MEKEDKPINSGIMRYFLISYVFLDKRGRRGYGSFTEDCASFPNYSEIIKELDGIFHYNASITNIFEFKSKEDYESFAK